MTDKNTPIGMDSLTEKSLLGSVTIVKSRFFKFELSRIQNGAGSSRFKQCSSGAYVIAGNGSKGFLGKVEDVQLSHETFSGNNDGIGAIASVQLIAEINFETSEVIFTGNLAPQVGDSVHNAPPALIEFVVDSHESDDERPMKIHLGTLRNGTNSPLEVSPESLFGRHCAVLGATGGGKSWTVAKLVEECAKLNSKVVLFDATGEYRTLKNGVDHVHFGSGHDDHKGSNEVTLPYTYLTESDLFAIFKPTGDSQAPKLRAAIKSLKLARLCPAIAAGGTILKAYRSKVEYEEEYHNWLPQIESPYADFDISLLTKQIENECVAPQSSATEPRVWGGPDAIDQGNCVALITRINDIIYSPSLSPIFNPSETPSLLDELKRFLKDPARRVFCISIQNLSFAFHAREIAANAIGRRILAWGREGRFVNLPVVLVVDEAHQFLNQALVDDDSPFPLNAFSLLAKEGRKYSVNLCLATQRPRDIPEGVLSQMGTLIVHRLVNDLDREVIERAASDADTSTLATIPALAPGEALFMGVDFHLPLLVQIAPPVNKPISSGANYQKFWGERAPAKTKVRDQ